MRTNEEKFRTVIDKNTFYFHNPSFEESYEGHVNSLREILLVLENRINNSGLTKEVIEKFILEREHGLKAILALTGFSNEYFKRLITLIRVIDDPELVGISLKNEWGIAEDATEGIKEWSDKKVLKLIKENEYFRKGMVNIFFEGATIPFLSRTIPLFELKKLSIKKLSFEVDSLVDTLVRYKEKGSYTGKKENNPETLVEEILDELEITHEKGDLDELIDNAPETKRTMDFIIPNKREPLVIAESSFQVTTSSLQGDKSKTEISIDRLIKEHYPNAAFIGFIDGIGWYVRKGDLRRMVTAYQDVFTYHREELLRFKTLLTEKFQKL